MTVTILDHPAIVHKLSIMRDKTTPTTLFRQVLREITPLLAYESTRHLPLKTVTIETPLCRTQSHRLQGKKMVLVSILRAGNGMLDGYLDILPNARVGFVGMERDQETATAHSYYCKLPHHMHQRHVIVVDPMLATGGSAVETISKIKQYNPLSITFSALIAAPEGVQALQSAHPDVAIVLAELDEKLNEKSYIIPGLGDAGDRIFGTVEK